MDTLKYDKPSSKGVANVLERAEIAASFRWTPIKDVPRTARIDKSIPFEEQPISKFSAWKPVVGLPYSSVRYEENFLGINISFETFLSALANPKSVMYTRDLTGKGKRMSAWYGTVCSAFVSFALALPFRRVCSIWGSFSDMKEIVNEPLDSVQLGDILCSRTHVALITGIGRNSLGKPVEYCVTECTTPQMTKLVYNRNEFKNYWLKEYKVFRYTKIDQTPDIKDSWFRSWPSSGDTPQINSVLIPDYGNKANYRLGQSVEFNILEEGWSSLVIEAAAGEQQVIFPISGTGVISWMPDNVGAYRAHCVNGKMRSQEAECCVTNLSVTIMELADCTKVCFENPAGDRALCAIVSDAESNSTISIHELTKEENLSGSFFLKGIKKGCYDVHMIAENCYGQYSSYPVRFNIGQL